MPPPSRAFVMLALTRSALSALWCWLRTVPVEIPSTPAMSWSVRSSKYRSTTTARCPGGSSRSAAITSRRAATGPPDRSARRPVSGTSPSSAPAARTGGACGPRARGRSPCAHMPRRAPGRPAGPTCRASPASALCTRSRLCSQSPVSRYAVCSSAFDRAPTNSRNCRSSSMSIAPPRPTTRGGGPEITAARGRPGRRAAGCSSGGRLPCSGRHEAARAARVGDPGRRCQCRGGPCPHALARSGDHLHGGLRDLGPARPRSPCSPSGCGRRPRPRRSRSPSTTCPASCRSGRSASAGPRCASCPRRRRDRRAGGGRGRPAPRRGRQDLRRRIAGAPPRAAGRRCSPARPPRSRPSCAGCSPASCARARWTA